MPNSPKRVLHSDHFSNSYCHNSKQIINIVYFHTDDIVFKFSGRNNDDPSGIGIHVLFYTPTIANSYQLHTSFT